MNESAKANQMDSLLLPYLRAEDEAESQELLTELVRAEADPVILGIIGRKLQVSLNGDKQRSAAQDAEDVRSEVLLQVVSLIGALKTEKEAVAISNFRSYVAVMAHNACHEFLRRKYPERSRLKNRLRYLLTHQPDFALWENEQEEWLCGLNQWQGKINWRRGAASLAGLRDDVGAAAERLGLAGRNLPLMNPAELVGAIFKHVGRPVEFDELVSVVAALQHIKSPSVESAPDNEETEDAYEGLVDAGSDIAGELEQRRYVEKLWREICELPQRQRAALLLNLRDDNGGDVIALFPMLGVASLREIASVLELPPEDFAALWHDLPLDDVTIAERLGLKRQQVINLRKSARERLARRMREF